MILNESLRKTGAGRGYAQKEDRVCVTEKGGLGGREKFRRQPVVAGKKPCSPSEEL